MQTPQSIRECETVMKGATELRGLAGRALAYTAYGYLRKVSGAALGFNGEWKDELLQGYALGNGHRLYCPALMRFCSPDVLSPFGKGGSILIPIAKVIRSIA